METEFERGAFIRLEVYGRDAILCFRVREIKGKKGVF